ncbi:MAG TPA: hypothetical protein VHM91_07335, partial [Verrucomicrobiales bacterium]|nr:hypothetical protein [Verrucomicrobiales bacterium]
PLALGPFGIGSCHVNNRSARDNDRWVPQMEAIGLRYYRTCHSGWGEVEPVQQGKFEWKNLDEQMDYLTKHRMSYGGIFIGSPSWNKADKPGYLPVNNLTGWSAYVTAVVGHCKSRVKRWEVWNEPPNFTGRNQTPVDYAKIVVSAYDAAKAADPDCLIGLAAKSCHVNYLEQVIKAGAKDHFDYITLHPYEILDGVLSGAGTEPVYMNIVPCLRKMLAAQNPAKKDVPVIFTELGCDVKKGADVQAHALIKAYTMGIAQGVSCIQWFEGMDGDSGPMGLLDGKAVPRPCYQAMAQMILLLGEHPVYQGWVMLNQKHYGFVFKGSKGMVMVAWGKGPADEVSFDKEVSIVNPLAGTVQKAAKLSLTTAPAFILEVPEALLSQAAASRGKPLPWGGDFARADSVSLTMENGRQNERGLHTLSGDALAKAVVAYGGSARAGSVPGGNVFVVDPAFSSYTAEPLEITVVVRRNEANDNSGFKLDYESTTGLKTAKSGWYTVPDNKQWHTVKWQIDDAQFVNYWGYNFALTSDGNTYNKYYLQSVTVTKRK